MQPARILGVDVLGMLGTPSLAPASIVNVAVDEGCAGLGFVSGLAPLTLVARQYSCATNHRLPSGSEGWRGLGDEGLGNLFPLANRLLVADSPCTGEGTAAPPTFGFPREARVGEVLGSRGLGACSHWPIASS